MRIEPISLFEPSRVTYTPKINPIKREIESQKREKRERKQKRKKAEEQMNLMAQNFADIMLSYDENAQSTHPSYYSFNKES